MTSTIEQFKRAVWRGDASALRRLLERHQEVRDAINEPIFAFDAPALVAVRDSVDVVDVLLEFGADPNRRSDWWAGSFHPLHRARGAVTDRLLAAGAVPDACAAASLDRPDLLERILREDPARVHERGGDGQTPLHFAASRRIVDQLLAAGADPDARDIDHRSSAAEWMLGDDPDTARPDLARYLVERGAAADVFLVAALGLTERARTMLQSDPSLVKLRTSQGKYGEKPPSSLHIYQWTIGPNLSPLQVAAKFGQHETLAAMKTFATPAQRLLLACHLGLGDEARVIVRESPDILRGLDISDRRALTDEAWAANAPAVELLLELGFDPSQHAANGGNALHCAAWGGSVACLTPILRHPVGRSLIDSLDSTYHGTPLGWCCHGSVNCGSSQTDHAEVARLLLAAGARLEPQMRGCGERMQAVIDAARQSRSLEPQ